MRGMIRLCLLELKDRKVIYVYGILALMVILATIGSRMVEVRFQGMAVGADDVNRGLGNPLIRGYATYMYVLVLLTVMATAGLIPAMLKRGRADYYLSKPVSRTRLLLGRLTSISIVYGAVMVLTFAVNYGFTVALYGLFSFKVLYIVVINLIVLLIWLSITAFAGVLTGSTAHAIMAAFSVWLIQKILQFHDIPKRVIDSKPATYAIDGLYYIFPKTGEISDLIDELIEGDVSSWMPLYSSIIFAGALMFVTILVFRRKDY